jgi:hypothetical protein
MKTMRRYRISMTAVSMALFATLPSAARADDIEDLKRNQEELRKIVESQQKEIDRLRGEMAHGSGGEGAALADAVADLSKAADNSGPVVWKQISKQGSKFTLYGFVRLDMQYDSARPNSTNVPAWIRSEDTSAPDSIRAPNDSSDFNMSTKLTRLGLDFAGPTVTSLHDAQASAKIEIDFYGSSGTSSRSSIRMRQAYLKLTWQDEFTLLAGQTQDVISPLIPVVNNDFVMWGAGNTGDRRPQLRAEWTPSIGEGTKLILQGMMGDNGAVDGTDRDATGTAGATYIDGQTSGSPIWEGRTALRFKNWDDKDVELGVWGYTATQDQDTPIAGHGSFSSGGYGIDVSVPLVTDQLWLKGELWTGSNMSDVRGGILQGVNTTTGDKIAAQGGWVELGGKATTWMTLTGGYAYDNPDSGDLSAGGLTGGRDLNTIWYLASRMNFEEIELGLEYLHWKTEFVGFKDGTDDRIVAFIAYKF